MTKQQTKKLAIHLATHDGSCYFISELDCTTCFTTCYFGGIGVSCSYGMAKTSAIRYIAEKYPDELLEVLL